ncbi:hypothetical protein HPB49_016260 [Dermacentor silvarum]|uniref:Uncharacterized protein n=1 Tax=Dermacentor silvarum TaxID=543639 RepID=A0ACB8CY41_DERSI|nr:hypothetical protein HPB49_016260 [Dermacentor silvarum]
MVISTPSTQNVDRDVRIKSIQVNEVTHEVSAYEAAPDNTTKGVTRGIPLTDNARQIDANIVNDHNLLALAAKRIGSTTTIVITFDGPDVPCMTEDGPFKIKIRVDSKSQTYLRKGNVAATLPPVAPLSFIMAHTNTDLMFWQWNCRGYLRKQPVLH